MWWDHLAISIKPTRAIHSNKSQKHTPTLDPALSMSPRQTLEWCGTAIGGGRTIILRRTMKARLHKTESIEASERDDGLA